MMAPRRSKASEHRAPQPAGLAAVGPNVARQAVETWWAEFGQAAPTDRVWKFAGLDFEQFAGGAPGLSDNYKIT
jgi:hypothetical protein